MSEKFHDREEYLSYLEGTLRMDRELAEETVNALEEAWRDEYGNLEGLYPIEVGEADDDD